MAANTIWKQIGGNKDILLNHTPTVYSLEPFGINCYNETGIVSKEKIVQTKWTEV